MSLGLTTGFISIARVFFGMSRKHIFVIKNVGKSRKLQFHSKFLGIIYIISNIFNCKAPNRLKVARFAPHLFANAC